MKKYLLFFLLLKGSCYVFPQELYKVPENIHAQGYDAHVELSWMNQNSFDYQIFLSKDNGKTFIRRAVTSSNYYLDFVNDLGKNLNLIYRIVPAGMDPQSADARKFQIVASTKSFNDDQLLDMIQRYTTRYFFDLAHPESGMARERSNDLNGDVVTTGGTGFGIMALIAASERKYITRQQLFERISRIVRFLNSVERFHGAWAHWYNGNTGKVFNFSKFDDGGDIVETAFLTEGLLTAYQYFVNGNDAEQSLSQEISRMWDEIDWNWYTQGTDSLYWHWSKNYGFKINHRIIGFDETMITYVLAASSKTHPIKPEVFHDCYTKSTYFFNGKKYYGITLSLGMEMGGPLFFTHYSFLGLDPHGLKDRYADYFERNRAHVLIQRQYAIHNPKKHKGFGENSWGFTSSDDPLTGYSSHQPGTDEENGTISPTAAISSIPYAPEECLTVARHFYYDMGSQILGRYGFYDAFNLDMIKGQQVVKSYLAIDQGPIAVMIENFRSQLLWNLFMKNEDVLNGLKKLGFRYEKP